MAWTAAAAGRASEALCAGFAALDRDVQEQGFWDAEARTFARALLGARGERGVQAADDRYTPFGLAGALRGHRQSGRGDRGHLRAAVDWASARLGPETPSDSLYYGGIWALIEAARTFDDDRMRAQAQALAQATRTAFLASVDLNYGVGLFALSQLAALTPEDRDLRDAVASKARQLAERVDARGYPLTGDRRAAYHQRLMYTSWGLLGAAALLDDEAALRAASRILDAVTRNRIDADGGIRWHALIEWKMTPAGWPRLYPYGSNLYYECHQCFYLIALDLLHALAPVTDMAVPEKVLGWMFGHNRWHLDLTTQGVNGLPVRCVARSGRVAPPPNRFKGCYEVGAYLWQMSNVTANAVEAD
ncbi:MAG: hypothetical protein H6926_04380 [Chromatiales bacterium]|nr:hypothetical protein [Chromatiales bacterium]